MRYVKIFFLLILIHGSGLLFSQQQGLDTIKHRFHLFRENAFQEKLFVHTDQNFYLTGENLWFRIFYVEGSLHQPQSLSKIAYVEVLDKNNRAVIQSKVQLVKGGGEGSLFIPATLGSGEYLLRVYTQWMRNYPAEYFFQKSITIVNPFIRPEYEATRKEQVARVEFFPEGGILLAGHRSKVGFKISAPFSTDSLKAVIIRNNQDTVAALQPLVFGLGHFYFTPEPGQIYQCVFHDKKGKVIRYRLPEVHGEGYAMEVTESDPNALKIRVVGNVSDNTASYVYLFAHCRQVVEHAEAKVLNQGEVVFTIDKTKLQGGITHFTVFNGELNPICERLYFKTPDKNLSIQVHADQNSYTTRRKVVLDLSASYGDKSIPADLSVSVCKMDSLSSPRQEDIYTYLYLTSDLSGDVASPLYYFSEDRNVREAADNLMLTHGWRKFKWENVLQKKYSFDFIPEFRSHLVTGTVTKNDQTPAAGITTYLSSPGKLVNVYGARSNKKGLVQFEVRDFWGTRQLIMHTNSSVDSTYTLSVNNPYDETTPKYRLAPFGVTPDMEEVLNSRSVSMQVQDIFYREESERILSIKQDSTAFYGKANETYYLDDYTRFPVMEEVMREYVPGVLVRKRRDGFHFIVVDKIKNGLLPDNPLILLDGVPVFDADDIMAFDPLRVKKLEVVTGNYYVGPLALSGIVSYSTYAGDLAGFQLDPGTVKINYEGLQLKREFYSPRYENQKLRASRLPDQRNLIHWAPQVSLENGKKTIEFYTSDVTGDFIVFVNGLGNQGVAGSATFKFSVKSSEF